METTVLNSVCMALTTRYMNPTNRRGARIRVQCGTSTMFVPYSYELNTHQSHAYAALQFVKKMGWSGELVMSTLNNSTINYVFTFISKEFISHRITLDSLKIVGAV